MSTPIFSNCTTFEELRCAYALRNLSFHIGEGEVVGLLVTTRRQVDDRPISSPALHKPTDGYLSVDGKTTFSCRSDSPMPASKRSISTPRWVDSLSITRNIFMGRELTDRFGFLRQREMRDIHGSLQNAVHISGIDSPDTLAQPSGGQKQAVRNRRAVYSRSACCSSTSRPRSSPYARGSVAEQC